jgi:hypothetical protein
LSYIHCTIESNFFLTFNWKQRYIKFAYLDAQNSDAQELQARLQALNQLVDTASYKNSNNFTIRNFRTIHLYIELLLIIVSYNVSITFFMASLKYRLLGEVDKEAARPI